MPLHPDFVKIRNSFLKRYGERGEEVYHRWLNEHKLDDTKPMPKHIRASIEGEFISFEAAKWTRKFMNDLPDSAFAWIQPGGKKDSGGKTVPRTYRHLPYKDANGNVDLPHLRNAIARLGQGKPFVMPATLRSSVQKRLQSILARMSK